MANFILPRALFKSGTKYANEYNRSYLKSRSDIQWWYKGVIPISREISYDNWYVAIEYERLRGYNKQTSNVFYDMFKDFQDKWYHGGKDKEYMMAHKQEFIDDCEKAYQKYIDYCDANGIEYYVKD